jgi:hypothetical protein
MHTHPGVTVVFLQYYFGLGAKLTLDENKKSNILLVWPFSSNKNN